MNITGYASVFGNVDSYGDIVEQGAFVDSPNIERVKLCYQHNISDVIGRINQLKEDERGLWIDATILPTSLGKDVSILLEGNAINEMSIGYRIIEQTLDENRNHHLTKLHLIEISIVSRAANEEAVVLSLEKKSELMIDELSEMSDERLTQLKNAIDNEFNARILTKIN